MMAMDWFFILTSLAKTIGVIFLIILPMVSYAVYAERRVSALIQDRLGPNRVGPSGLFQPIADAVKFLLKEDFTPAHVNTFYYWLAPCLAMVPAIATIAVVPFGSSLLGVPMVIADINVGVLYVFAIASLGVYGIVIAGWSSNSKYPFLGGVRSTSQMISYELSLGLAVIPIFLLVGQLRLTEIVRYQIEHGWMIAPFIGDWTSPQKWLLAIPMFISFCVFTIAIFAETNRLPFDLARSRNRTRRRISHRIRLDEIRALLPRRIRRHDHRLRDHRHPLPRRLASAHSLVARQLPLGAWSPARRTAGAGSSAVCSTSRPFSAR